jgi:hypothetical protein
LSFFPCLTFTSALAFDEASTWVLPALLLLLALLLTCAFDEPLPTSTPALLPESTPRLLLEPRPPFALAEPFPPFALAPACVPPLTMAEALWPVCPGCCSSRLHLRNCAGRRSCVRLQLFSVRRGGSLGCRIEVAIQPAVLQTTTNLATRVQTAIEGAGTSAYVAAGATRTMNHASKSQLSAGCDRHAGHHCHPTRDIPVSLMLITSR